MAMTPLTEMDAMLHQFDMTKFESYPAFMRAFLLHAMSNTDKSCDTILYEVQVVNKSIYEHLCKGAIRNMFEADKSLRN